MGEIDLNKFGLSGKIGPIVAYITKSGKQAYREYIVPNDPRTPKQLAYRSKFALVNSSLTPFCKVIKDGYSQKHNAYRSVISKVLREAIEGEYPNFRINYSKMQVAGGRLQLPTDITSEFDSELGALRITWNTKTCDDSKYNRSGDKVNIVCFDESRKKVFVKYYAASRRDGELTHQINESYESINPKDLHFWIYLSSRDLEDNSDSWYVEV